MVYNTTGLFVIKQCFNPLQLSNTQLHVFNRIDSTSVGSSKLFLTPLKQIPLTVDLGAFHFRIEAKINTKSLEQHVLIDKNLYFNICFIEICESLS